jgi:hypothetical protein
LFGSQFWWLRGPKSMAPMPWQTPLTVSPDGRGLERELATCRKGTCAKKEIRDQGGARLLFGSNPL